MNVSDIRKYFIDALNNEEFTRDRTGSETIEMLGASFVADEPAVFGEVNEDYVTNEIEWYHQMSTNVNDIYPDERPAPAAWKATANEHGEINSNYGLLVFGGKYFNQFDRVVDELSRNPDSRRANMIYTRPSIWEEYDEAGKSDFICTNAVSYYIRDNAVHCVVQMRSNDLWAGYRNDRAWQLHTLKGVTRRLNNENEISLTVGKIHWQVQNLHCYEKNFYLIDHCSKTDEIHITKPNYCEKYPNSKYIV